MHLAVGRDMTGGVHMLADLQWFICICMLVRLPGRSCCMVLKPADDVAAEHLRVQNKHALVVADHVSVTISSFGGLWWSLQYVWVVP